MSLIKCPECGKEISSNADKCIYCGYPLAKDTNETVSDDSVQQDYYKEQDVKAKSPIKKIILVAILLAMLVGGIYAYKSVRDQKISEQYKANLVEAVQLMWSGAAKSEECLNLTLQVWHNSIYKSDDEETNKYTKTSSGSFYDDFNDSLKALFADQEFSDKLSEISENQSQVVKVMAKLQNPPEDWKKAYDELEDLYDIYVEFTAMALNPNGSYNSVSEDFTDLDNKIVKSLNKILVYLQ